MGITIEKRDIVDPQKKLIFIFWLFISSMSGYAEELSSPVFLGRAGAGGASLKEDFSYLINPATIGFQQQSKGALAYSFKKNKKLALLSLLDNQTKIPVAISYQRAWSDSFKKRDRDKMLFSSGFKVLPYLSLGLTVEKGLKPSEWNGALGSVLRMGELSLSLLFSPILKKENKNQRALSLAFYYDWKNFFSTYLDVSKTAHQSWIFKGGLESSFRSFLSVRLGGLWRNKDQEGIISGGLAFFSPKLSLEYSIQKDQRAYQQAIWLSLRI